MHTKSMDKTLNRRHRQISHILGTGRPTNFKQMEYDGLHHQHARWPPKWKLWVDVQVIPCRGQRHIGLAPKQAAQLGYTWNYSTQHTCPTLTDTGSGLKSLSNVTSIRGFIAVTKL